MKTAFLNGLTRISRILLSKRVKAILAIGFSVFGNGLSRISRIRLSKRVKIILTIGFSALLLIEFTGYYLGGWTEPQSHIDQLTVSKQTDNKNRLQARNKQLKNRLAAKKSRNPFIIVDTARNRLTLVSQNTILLESVISAGSGNILDEPGGTKQWVFDTPRGQFLINSKLVAPVWKKPDWAFIEEGEQIPRNDKDRMENGALGDYAMGFGQGYFIHGTLYTRLLGRNVTHGCIRVGDKHLKSIYEAVNIGTHVYIY